MAGPPIDPALAAFAADPRNLARRPPPSVGLDRVRKAADAAMIAAGEGPGLASVVDLRLPDNNGLAVRLYRPSDSDGLPLVLFFHGGGFTWGSIETHDGLCRALAATGGFAIASLGYRLAPEARFPAQLEDARALARWAAADAAALGLDGGRIGLCGDSAGAWLALAAALRIDWPSRPRGLALFYPMLDPTLASPSASRFASGPGVTRDALLWFWDNVAGAGGTDAMRLADEAPGRLPPTSLIVAGIDPLRDEALDLARRLEQGGTRVRLREYDGMIHGFMGLPRLTPIAGKAIAAAAGDLAEFLA